MSNLEQDIRASQVHILDWLNQYEKVSEQIIRQNYTVQFHQLLDSISSSDYTKIKQVENIIKDEVLSKHVLVIVDKIKNYQQKKKLSSQIAGAQKKEQTVKKIDQPTKRIPAIATQNKKQERGGFINSVMKRFVSKQKKASVMIFPNKQPEVHYDPVTRSYIFEGEEPEAPKVIPKPPSVSEKKKAQQNKKTNASEEKQLDVMTAPPVFKRKSTQKGPSKPKTKLKEQIQVAAGQQLMNFAKVVENINHEYTELLEKYQRGAYDKHPHSVKVHSLEQLNEFISFSENILTYSQEISQYQSKLVDKWSKMVAGQNKQLKVMQNVLKQLNEPSSLTEWLQKISKDKISQKKSIKVSHSHEISVKEESQLRVIDQLREQKLGLVKKNSALQLSNKVLRQQSQHQSHKISQFTNQREILLRNIEAIRNNNEHLNDQCKKLVHQIELTHKDNENNKHKIDEKIIKNNKQLQSKVQQLKKVNFQLQLQKTEAKQSLEMIQIQLSKSNEYLNSQLHKQKAKAQSQLKHYEDKQNLYLKSMKKINSHQILNRQFEEALYHQNRLLHEIFERQLQLNRSTELEQLSPKISDDTLHTQTATILQLSDIVTSITETHLDRLQMVNRSYNHLHRKYLESKEQISSVKNNALNQNISLNRSVTRLKSLIETYKAAKEQAESKCLQMQLQCDKLNKKLQHFKQQQKFNKSYLSKIKSKSAQNQSMMSLQEDNEQLVERVNELQRELGMKDESLTKMQNNLQDLLENYERNQFKAIEVEKKMKESEKQLRLFREEKDQNYNQVKLLQLKLLNQKEKYEGLIGKQQLRVKNIEVNFDKKMKIIRHELQQATKRQERLRQEFDQSNKEKEKEVRRLKEFYLNRQRQLQDGEAQKEEEYSSLLLLLEAKDVQIERIKTQNDSLKQMQQRRQEKENEIRGNMNSIIQEQLEQMTMLRKSEYDMKEIIGTLAQQITQLEGEELQFKDGQQNQLATLKQLLYKSNLQSEDLQNELQNYGQLIAEVNIRIEQLQAHNSQREINNAQLLKDLQKQNNKFAGLITILKDEVELLKREKVQVEEVIDSMNDQINSFKLQIQKLQQQNLSLNESMLNKEEQIARKNLMVASTEQLLNKKNHQIVYQQQRNSLSNLQIQNLNSILQGKQKQIDQLRSQIQIISTSLIEQEKSRQQQLLAKNALLYQEVISLKGDIQIKQNILDNLQQKLYIVNEEVESKSREIQKLNQKIVSLSILQTEVQELTELVETLNKTGIQKQQTIKLLQQNLAIKQSKTNQLQLKLATKQEELIQVNLYLQQKERNIAEREEAKDSEVEGGVEQLLKQFEEKQNIITQLKEKVDHQAKIAEEANKRISLCIQEIQQLKNNYALLQQDKEGSNERLHTSLQVISSLQQQRSAQTKIIEYLTNKLQEEKALLQMEKAKQRNELKVDDNVIQNVLQECQIKDKTIEELQNNLQKYEGIIEKMQKSQYEKDLYIKQIQKVVQEHSRMHTQHQIIQQQNQRIIKSLNSQLQQLRQKIIELQNSNGDLSEIIQNQQRFLELKNSNESMSLSQNQENNSLRQSVEAKSNQVSELKKKMQQISKSLSEKQKDYQVKIQNLQREIISLVALKNANKKLQESVKDLEIQNTTLTNQKIQLMRSNDYLLEVNEKLVEGKSPHPKEPRKVAPIKSEDKDKKEKEQKESKGQKEQPKDKKQTKESKDQTRDGGKSQTRQQKGKGFFGSISSIFLTPTESDRLIRK